jgi:hypothetical protein
LNEFWKREQFAFQVRYGQELVEDTGQERASFQGRMIRQLATDEINHQYYPKVRRALKQILGFLISFVILCCIIAIVFFLFFLKKYFTDNRTFGEQFRFLEGTIPSLANTFQILFFNAVYTNLAIWFNDFENHKSLVTFENSLIAKIYAFVFVNTFNSMFFIAFVNKYAYFGCQNNDCFGDLQAQMRSIFIVNFIKNAQEIGQPALMAWLRKRKRVADPNPEKHLFNQIDEYIESQYFQEKYAFTEELDGTFGDYMEMIIQYSFLALFGLAFPIAFLMALGNNIAEIQVDKIKLFEHTRRPIPQPAAHIGTWFFILEFISFASIFVNAGLICFTSDSIDSSRIQAFTMILIACLAVKYLAQFFIPDEPEKIKILKQRYDKVVDKYLKGFEITKRKKLVTLKPCHRVACVAGRAEMNDEVQSGGAQGSGKKD